jgi:hypothetical protein
VYTQHKIYSPRLGHFHPGDEHLHLVHSCVFVSGWSNYNKLRQIWHRNCEINYLEIGSCNKYIAYIHDHPIKSDATSLKNLNFMQKISFSVCEKDDLRG